MIIAFGLSNRGYVNNFERYLLSQANCQKEMSFFNNCQQFLGKNWSFLVTRSESDDETKMILFDADDASGWNSDNFKLNQNNLRLLLKEFDADDFIVFKAQYSETHIFNRYNPLQRRTYPLGYFCDNPEEILNFKRSHPKLPLEQRDIDFLWVGTINRELTQDVWPADLSFDYWTPGIRWRCFDAVKEIKKRRKDWNIVCSSEKLNFNEYINLLQRTKICLEWPGIGYNTRRFFENLMFEKVSLMHRNKMILPYTLEENKHFFGFSPDLRDLEECMSNAISNNDRIQDVESNISQIQNFLTHEYAYNNIKSTFMKHFGRRI